MGAGVAFTSAPGPLSGRAPRGAGRQQGQKRNLRGRRERVRARGPTVLLPAGPAGCGAWERRSLDLRVRRTGLGSQLCPLCHPCVTPSLPWACWVEVRLPGGHQDPPAGDQEQGPQL